MMVGQKLLKLKRKRLSKQILAILLGAILALGWGYTKETQLAISWRGQAAIAQTPVARPDSVAAIVYQRLSYLPKENQYLRQDTKKVDQNNTLIARFVRYHQDVKKRSTRFRFDWKLTLADYLGVNESLKADRYPGKSTLTVNPMQKDVEAIRSLTRRQRDELVDALADAFKVVNETPAEQNAPPNNSPEKPSPQPQSSPAPENPSQPSLSNPGDSDLLKP
jgi:hypothetical protein